MRWSASARARCGWATRVRGGVIAFYALALALWGLAFWLMRGDGWRCSRCVPAAAHLLWQAFTLDPADADNPLARFRSNRFAGLLVAAACFVVGNALSDYSAGWPGRRRARWLHREAATRGGG